MSHCLTYHTLGWGTSLLFFSGHHGSDQCCSSVCDAGPTLTQQWPNVSWLLSTELLFFVDSTASVTGSAGYVIRYHRTHRGSANSGLMLTQRLRRLMPHFCWDPARISLNYHMTPSLRTIWCQRSRHSHIENVENSAICELGRHISHFLIHSDRRNIYETHTNVGSNF